MILLSHKRQLSPNNKQATYFSKACGVARFSYNWALNEWKLEYDAGLKPNETALRRKLNSIKKEQFPWMFEVTENKIKISHIGWVKLCESLRFIGKIMSATISRKADKWFVSLTVEGNPAQTAHENQGVVGVDLGVKTLTTLSTGEEIKGSKNRNKAKQKLAKLHARISNIRLDAIHKLTTSLAHRFNTIVIEDLNVRGMVKNRKLARSISDMSFYEFRRQLEYKLKFRNGNLIVADRFFASSKLCGFKYENLLLSERVWTCAACNTIHNRDVKPLQRSKKQTVDAVLT